MSRYIKYRTAADGVVPASRIGAKVQDAVRVTR
jgi:hypothetical protein